MKNTFILKIKKYPSLNIKSHDLLNIYFPSNYTIAEMSLKNIKKFLINNNNCNTTIIYYCQTILNVNNIILECVKNMDVKFKFIFFTFDYWFAYDKHYNNYLKELFRADKYKVVCFAQNIEQLMFYQKNDYEPYKENLIFNNIWCCYNSCYCDINPNPKKQLLVSGAICKHYPERVALIQSNNKYVCKRKYVHKELETNVDSYKLDLNKYYACFVSSVYVYRRDEYGGDIHNTHAILLKNYEILAVDSLLVNVMREKEHLSTFGLQHMENCYLIDFEKDIHEQINYIFDNFVQ